MNARVRIAFVRALVLTMGIFHTLTASAMLFAPEWFFQNIGTYPPYNRHYTGDLGTFQLALGVALLWAVRAPEKHHLLIGAAALGNLLHTFNHAYDDLLLHSFPSGQTILLLIFALLLLIAWLIDVPKRQHIGA
ncbi:MAG: hypothetical protein U0528_04500 [Anaerolineae bacterium]|nr:hypothetical protein [Anaerolineae bacterium]